MTIERIIWTSHAEDRCARRLLDRAAVELAILDGHSDRQINRGDAAWRVYGLLADGRRFAAVYDHPHKEDRACALIASVWEL